MVILFGPSGLKIVFGILITKFLRYFFGVNVFAGFLEAGWFLTVFLLIPFGAAVTLPFIETFFLFAFELIGCIDYT